MKTIRIGGGQGFWGDLNDAPIVMAKQDRVDYIACDYLAELTLSIMRRQQERRPEAGYARDFITVIKQILPDLKEKGTKVITNAGGMNVKQAVELVKQAIKESGLHFKIGYVLGDDVREILPKLREQGITMQHMDTGENIDRILPNMVNANVYFGVEPILECLEGGADIIILGRSTDTAMFEAPLIHEFGWKADDWDARATGILAGHLCECGAQATGGNYDYDWRNVPRPEFLGYPIAEVSKPGELIMTKTKNTGGLVTTQSIKEQLMYEIHDPAAYITPDVVADFSKITLEGIEKDHAGDYSSSVQSHQLNLMYQFNPNVAAFAGYVHNRAEGNGDSDTENGYQVGVLGNMKIAKRTTAWASIGVGNKITAYEIGVGYDLTKNFDVNLFYNDTKYKGFGDVDFKTHALVAAKQKNSAPVHKITIIPRTSGALGYTMNLLTV